MTFARTILLLVGLGGMVIFGAVIFTSPWPAAVAIVGLALGWVFRRIIVGSFKTLTWAIPAGMFAYGIVLFVGDRLFGLSGEMQLLIITITTIVMFNIQFWSLSDPTIVNTENDN